MVWHLFAKGIAKSCLYPAEFMPRSVPFGAQGLLTVRLSPTKSSHCKCRPSNGVKAQATAGTEDLTAAVQWRTAEKHELSAAVRWPFPISGKPSKPQCQLTGTWKF